MKHSILLHEPDDDVGVAVVDLEAGAEVGAVTLEGQVVGTVKLVEGVPLGHKVAMHDMTPGHRVIEYGRIIGQCIENTARGSHVHTHNLKTMRWTV